MKRIVSIFVSLLMTMGLMACSNSNDNTTTSNTETEVSTDVEEKEVEQEDAYDVGDFTVVVPDGWHAQEVEDLEDGSIKKDEIHLVQDDGDEDSIIINIMDYKDESLESIMDGCKETYSEWKDYDFNVEGKDVKAATAQWSFNGNVTYFHFLFFADGDTAYHIACPSNNPEVKVEDDVLIAVVESITTK